MSNTPLRVSSDDWAEFVNAGKVLLEESKMSKGDKNRTKDRESYRETMDRIKRNEEKKEKKDDEQIKKKT